jgi:hypothetical protein
VYVCVPLVNLTVFIFYQTYYLPSVIIIKMFSANTNNNGQALDSLQGMDAMLTSMDLGIRTASGDNIWDDPSLFPKSLSPMGPLAPASSLFDPFHVMPSSSPPPATTTTTSASPLSPIEEELPANVITVTGEQFQQLSIDNPNDTGTNPDLSPHHVKQEHQEHQQHSNIRGDLLAAAHSLDQPLMRGMVTSDDTNNDDWKRARRKDFITSDNTISIVISENQYMGDPNTPAGGTSPTVKIEPSTSSPLASSSGVQQHYQLLQQQQQVIRGKPPACHICYHHKVTAIFFFHTSSLRIINNILVHV